MDSALEGQGHDVRYRNIWIRELDLEEPNTDFENDNEVFIGSHPGISRGQR